MNHSEGVAATNGDARSFDNLSLNAAALFQMDGVSKRYGGVRALESASLHCEAGKIHAILGENGAGKSTLIKIMAGVIQPDGGTLRLDDRVVAFANPTAASAAGIACIFQELSLVPDLSVADNILLSNPPQRLGIINRREQRHLAEEALARAGAADIHPLAPVKELSLSRRQMVEIAKALSRRPRILILDEATSALTVNDVEKVFEVLKRLRSEGLALLYISHRMQEIEELADQCTVFRNGRNVATYAAGTKSSKEVVEMMIGREYNNVFPAKPPKSAEDGTTRLRLTDVSWTDRLRGISFAARPGEIIGLGGLDGQGQRELLLAIFGVLRGVTGKIEVDGRASGQSPRKAKRATAPMSLIPEDRKTEGLLLPMAVRDNLTLAALEKVSNFGFIDQKMENAAIAEMVKMLDIRIPNLSDPVSSLSGGNQQKVVIAKWLMIAPQIILLNDPTRGIDVGTKQEIYQLLRKLADQGATIVFYSTDYDELIGCCDRVLVMYDGAVIKTLTGAEITEHALISSALNLQTAETAVG